MPPCSTPNINGQDKNESILQLASQPEWIARLVCWPFIGSLRNLSRYPLSWILWDHGLSAHSHAMPMVVHCHAGNSSMVTNLMVKTASWCLTWAGHLDMGSEEAMSHCQPSTWIVDRCDTPNCCSWGPHECCRTAGFNKNISIKYTPLKPGLDSYNNC